MLDTMLLTARWTGAVLLLVNSALVVLIYVIRIFGKSPNNDEEIFSPLVPGFASFLAILGLLLSPAREPVWVWILFVALDIVAAFFAHRRYGKQWKALRRRLEVRQNCDE